MTIYDTVFVGGEIHTSSSGFFSSIAVHNNCTVSVGCSFSDNTTSACVAAYWQNVSNPYGLVNLVTTKLEKHENQNTAHALVELQGEKSEGYHIAVFAFNSKRNMIEGGPVALSYAVCEQGMYAQPHSILLSLLPACWEWETVFSMNMYVH